MSQSEDRRLPVALPSGREECRRRPRSAGASDWVHAAHIFGQTGARRGLRGGRYAIDQAHGAYLHAEWSGSADRRRPLGGLAEGNL
jgi:hypothetical protein